MDLVDANSAVIGTSGFGPFALPPGQYPDIAFPFDGQAIRANGVDGPYFARNLTVRGSTGSFLLVVDVLETQAYSFTEFGDPTTPNNCVSAGTGSWSSATTWTNCANSTPSATDSVSIGPASRVTLDTDATVASIRVESGGILRYDDAPR